MTVNIDSLFKNADPAVSDILNNALSEKEISAADGLTLLNAKGTDFHLTGMVANELRKRRVGDTVSYVINRNINFTNVCIKQCGFCAFSRDFREEEGYFLPTEEIVRRAKEAHQLGATEVCIQAGLPPDMEGDLYEKDLQGNKKRDSRHSHSRIFPRGNSLRSNSFKHINSRIFKKDEGGRGKHTTWNIS